MYVLFLYYCEFRFVEAWKRGRDVCIDIACDVFIVINILHDKFW